MSVIDRLKFGNALRTAAVMFSGGGSGLWEPNLLNDGQRARSQVVQDTRRDHDPWDDILEHVEGTEYQIADGAERRIATYELMHGYLGMAADRMTDLMGKRLSYTMRRLGWQGPMTLWINQKSTRGYRRDVTHKTYKDV